MQEKEPYQGRVNNLVGNILIPRSGIVYNKIPYLIVITDSPEFCIYSTTDYTNYLYITDHKTKILFVDNDTTLNIGSREFTPLIFSDTYGFYEISEYVNTYKNLLGRTYTDLGYNIFEKVKLSKGMNSTSYMLNLTNPDISDLLVDAREILAGETDYDTLYPATSFDDNLEPINSVSFRTGRIPIFTLSNT